MLIREFLVAEELKRVGYIRDIGLRLEARKAMLGVKEASMIMTEKVQETLQDLQKLEKGELEIEGDRELLERDFEQVSLKQDKKGNYYFEFDRKVKYFPHKKQGRFITL